MGERATLPERRLTAQDVAAIWEFSGKRVRAPFRPYVEEVMMDLTSPEARERIARAICRADCPWKDCAPHPLCPDIGRRREPVWKKADAALAEVAAMLKEE